MTNAFDFKAIDIDGKERSLDEFKGKAVLVVNTASKCGFTPQYTGLEQLWKDYGDKGQVGGWVRGRSDRLSHPVGWLPRCCRFLLPMFPSGW